MTTADSVWEQLAVPGQFPGSPRKPAVKSYGRTHNIEPGIRCWCAVTHHPTPEVTMPPQDMAAVLAAARNSPTVLALAAASVAQHKMATARDTHDYCDAAAALSDAVTKIRVAFLAASPHLAHAIAQHAGLAD